MLFLSFVAYAVACALMATTTAKEYIFNFTIESPLLRVIIAVFAYPLIALKFFVVGYVTYIIGWFLIMPFRSLLGL
jgi:hypothetical protein